MRLHRFIGDFDFAQMKVEIRNPEIIKQIKGVLRLKVGDKIILSDGKGKEGIALISSMDSKSITANMEKILEPKDVDIKVTLCLAILKKENFELAVQKAVEAGVSKIIPIITERTIKTGLNEERILKIIREASEQSGRGIIPTLSPILNFKEALAEKSETEEKIIFHLTNTLYIPNSQVKNSKIFIGPEGGFTENEIMMAKNSGYLPASLGQFTLRGETAAIIATYRAVHRI